MDAIWVFNGDGQFPSAVFSSREKAEAWIGRHRLAGTLTKYPIDVSVYDWVIEKGYWKPTRPHQQTPKFIQQFSSAYMEHYHYECGESLGENEQRTTNN